MNDHWQTFLAMELPSQTPVNLHHKICSRESAVLSIFWRFRLFWNFCLSSPLTAERMNIDPGETRAIDPASISNVNQSFEVAMIIQNLDNAKF